MPGWLVFVVMASRGVSDCGRVLLNASVTATLWPHSLEHLRGEVICREETGELGP